MGNIGRYLNVSISDGQSCYIMDAKSMGNIGRYLNVSISDGMFQIMFHKGLIGYINFNSLKLI